MTNREKRYMDKLNDILKDGDISLRISFYSKDVIKFENGLVLNTGSDICTFKQRINRSLMMIKGFDDIYKPSGIDNDVVENIKNDIRIQGGIKCQSLHGDRLKEIMSGNIPWNKGLKGCQVSWNKGLTKHTDDRVMKMSVDRKGDGNPNYGNTLSDEQRLIKSNQMKHLIEIGAFTPNIHNSQTHFQSVYNGQRYRSSWELVWHQLNPSYEYETLRIPYQLNGSRHIYIVDFIDHKKKIVVEIKPSTMHGNAKYEAKDTSLKCWCIDNEYIYNLVDEQFLVLEWDNIDLSLFDDKTKFNITKAYETCIKKNNTKT